MEFRDKSGHLIWLPPSEIRFTSEHHIWIIEHSTLLLDGVYPHDPRQTGYVDNPEQGRASASHKRAKFEIPCEIIAETLARLDKTGTDGKLLVWQIKSGVTHYEALEYEARRALRYISGWRRRRQSYAVWRKQQKYRER